MTVLAWHFCNADMRLGYGDSREIRDGETLEVDCEPVLCLKGLHASERIIDAPYYAQSGIVCRVEIGGHIVRGDDKLCGTSRKCLWHIDATKLLHEFACQCAESALAKIENPDQRSVAAIATKRRWLAGEATDAELAAARDAAWAAARDAAWDAAMAAAWAAARAAARAATRAAAWDAARDAQNTMLTSMVEAEHERLMAEVGGGE